MFNIIKYIQPTWYFNLKPKVDNCYFPHPAKADFTEIKSIIDNSFSENCRVDEMAFRLHKSELKNSPIKAGVDWWDNKNINPVDEYRFARKHYHTSRVFMALLLRIASLHNPVKEIFAFLKTSGTKRYKPKDDFELPEGYTLFESKLLKSNPKVTVIIPTLNRYEYLNDVLSDLEIQDYSNFDVIVVDQSQPFANNIYQNRKLTLKVIEQQEKALWLARNKAIEETSSEYLLLYDDDSRVKSNWISEHIKCIDYFNADISSGVSLSEIGGTIPKDYSYFKWSDQLDTGNVMIKRNVFLKIGLFDRQFEKQRMGDGEFGLRSYLAGFRNISNPLASRVHLKVGEGGLREMGSWDAYRPKNFWSPRPIPSVLYFYRKYFGSRAAMISIALNVPISVVPYKLKSNKPLLLLGSLFAIIISPIILVQVVRSWQKSSTMLLSPKIIQLKS